jgi:hypothetical protein
MITKMVLARARKTQEKTAARPSADAAVSAIDERLPAGPPPATEVPELQPAATLAKAAQPAAAVERAPQIQTVPAAAVAEEDRRSERGQQPQADLSGDAVKLSSPSEVESKLTRIADDFPTQSAPDTAADPGDYDSSSQFADTFEVPKVVSMQKSLKVTKKKKRFWLFRLFGRG